MSSIKKRQEIRENELRSRLDCIGIEYDKEKYNGAFHHYVKIGGTPTIDEIIREKELDMFLSRYTDYKTLRHEYYKKNFNMSRDMENTLKRQAVINYIMTNKNNTHKILNEIPWSLKSYIDSIYVSLDNP